MDKKILEITAEIQPKYPKVRLDNAMYRKVHKYLRRIKKGKILEVGCIDGSFLRILEKESWECKGLELLQHMVKKGRKLGTDIVQGDAQLKFPFKDKFDVILAGEVIEHMVYPDRFLENCHGALKKNGILILTTPNLTFLVNRFLVLFGRTPLFVGDFHFQTFTLESLKPKVEKYFEIEKISGSHVLVSKRRSKFFEIFEKLADFFPTLSAHLILICRKK